MLAILVIYNVAAQIETEENENGNRRIINGEDADVGEYPFMVSIFKGIKSINN